MFLYVNSASGLDPDAEAFLIATGISDATITSAINTLVIDLKIAGIWAKKIAIYPLVGGTAFTHKFNLKNPLDTDAAFRLSYVGSPTHSSNGMSCVSGHSNTNIVPSSNMVLNNTSLSVYSRTNSDGALYDLFSFGCIQFFARLSNLFLVDSYDLSGGGRVMATQTTSLGFFQLTRTLPTNNAIYYNGSLKASVSNTSGILNVDALFLGGNGVSGSGREYAFGSIGVGLTNAESIAFYTIVQDFQTTLGRQV